MVTGDGLKARRYARELVGEMRWRGMIVPRLYARMAGEFEDLVRSGDYAAWLAANQAPARLGSKSHVAGLAGALRPDRSGAGHGTSRDRRTAALSAPRRGLPLPGPARGR